MGQGFGFGFDVRTTADSLNPHPGSIGMYDWQAAYGTVFFVGPKQQLIIIMMMMQVRFGPQLEVYRARFSRSRIRR